MVIKILLTCHTEIPAAISDVSATRDSIRAEVLRDCWLIPALQEVPRTVPSNILIVLPGPKRLDIQ
jgi:hypothetical protein